MFRSLNFICAILFAAFLGASTLHKSEFNQDHKHNASECTLCHFNKNSDISPVAEVEFETSQNLVNLIFEESTDTGFIPDLTLESNNSRSPPLAA